MTDLETEIDTLRKLEQSSVAVYWDFENIHASIIDSKQGTGAYKRARISPQERVVDIEALMEFSDSFGAIAINRAYCNWQYFGKYQNVLLRNAVELIQLFPPGSSAKNGADIKLCLDATENIIRFPHIETIVIIGGDSDFLPVSQKIKAAGKTLVGVGCEAATNRHWAHNCHEFRYYETLLIEGGSGKEAIQANQDINETETSGTPDAVELIRRAIARLSANKGDEWVVKASIRSLVKRLDPTFDERTYGCTTFAELLRQHSSVFEVRKGEHDQVVRIKELHAVVGGGRFRPIAP